MTAIFRTACGVAMAIGFLASLFAKEAAPLGVPKVSDLVQPWLFVRASEASTLFIDESYEGREPYGHLTLSKTGEPESWLEYDGAATAVWKVGEVTRTDQQLELELFGSSSKSKLVVYPFWDIDDCLIMIRFDEGQEENPVRFSTPYYYKDTLPYLEPEG